MPHFYGFEELRMSLSKKEFSNYIKRFDFYGFFNEMGWDNFKTTQAISIDDIVFNLKGIVEKRGFKILLCPPLDNGKIPDYNIRKRIEQNVTKLFQEHLIIFYDADKKEQIWQWVIRQYNKPIKLIETHYHCSQDPQLLYQRVSGIFFELDEEENITLVDVTKRVAASLQQNNEKVTKQFYDKFKKEHLAFLEFIQGIEEQSNLDWYGSLMLNRLMFCYFIQKKGFLDNNKNYLQDKLNICQLKKGKDQFFSFYRNFLLVLFHEGLNAPQHETIIDHDGEAVEIGKIPYLNGGLFDKHDLEKTYTINIEDQAFERIFKFFDQYEWHLDARVTATGKDINPDVIGYIFEKYINDRAQMGAYYTKEDITDYISKNCIIPFVCDEVQRHYSQAFLPEQGIWELLKNSRDSYIYDAVKHGITTDVKNDLPLEVLAGFRPDLEQRLVDGRGECLSELRKGWNKPAPSEIALPTETYREMIERRKRYFDLLHKIEQGEIISINDFITYNLNIRQFVQDIIDNTRDAKLIESFYKALNKMTILDPTCGSGAFLFAAMNILEPLYESCIQRMESFVKEHPVGTFKFFEQTLQQVKSTEHPNLAYFIYKNIILRNLYGVDIMREAVEIAKLRLFLKLVATVDADNSKPNFGLEPLPDIDFNIRCGNTLVGFASFAEFEKQASFIYQNEKDRIVEKLNHVKQSFEDFKSMQLNGEDYRQAKKAYKNDLLFLQTEMNRYLAIQYGLEANNFKDLENFCLSHKPFHWFAEFYEIVHEKKGFDVIIGNPPYVEYSKVKKDYLIANYETEKCGNLYAFVIERSVCLLRKNGKFGFIVPLSSVSTPRMESILNIYTSNKFEAYFSFYAGDSNPSTLFNGVKSQLSIHLVTKNQENKIFTTNYIRWFEEYRNYLFFNMTFSEVIARNNVLFKIGFVIEKYILKKNKEQNLSVLNYFSKTSGDILYYRNASGSYYRLFLTEQPKLFINGKNTISTTLKNICSSAKEVFHCLFSSNLFHWYWTVVSDNYHITKKEFENFYFNMPSLKKEMIDKLNFLSKNLMIDYNKNSKFRVETDNKNTSKREVQIFEPRKSKPIIDEIDKVLGEHYGFTEEEVDFIINYDIKYRMGKELDEPEEN